MSRDKINLAAWKRKNRAANLDKVRAYERAKYHNNKEKKLASVKIWSAANPEKVKAAKQKYEEGNKDSCNARRKEWREKFPEKFKLCQTNWALENKPKLAATCRKYQASKLQRIPAWLDEDDFWLLEQVYELAALRTKMFGFDWHVDHVIPLQGKRVSGLHVPTNLAVIPYFENCRKNNGFVV